MKFKSFTKVFTRECNRILKSKSMLLICFGTPLVYSLLFSYLYINRRAIDIKTGVVNMDNSSTSRKLIRNINATPELKTTNNYTSSYEALNGIFNNDISAFYFIPNDFSKSLKKGRSALIFDAANSSNFLVASNVLKKITFTASSFSEKQFIKTLVDKGFSYKSTKSAFNPIKINTVSLFNTEMNYSDFLLPCLMLAILQQILLVAVCTSVSLEKTEKTQEELYKTAEGDFSAVFLGKAAPYILIGIIINIVNLYIMLPLNSIYVHSHLGLFLISTVFITAMVFFAILISSMFKSPEMVMAVLMFYALPTVLLSGFAWPHNKLPVILKTASYIFPSTYSMNYVRMFVLSNVNAKYALQSIVVLIIFAITCFLISSIIETKTQRIFSLQGAKQRSLNIRQK